jgi:hypothetical protein
MKWMPKPPFSREEKLNLEQYSIFQAQIAKWKNQGNGYSSIVM